MPSPTANPAGRVLIATFNRPAGVTGVHTHTRALRDGLAATGVACEVVSPFSGSRAWTPLFAVRPLLLKRVAPTQGTLWYRHWHAAALRTNLRRALRGSPVPHIIAQCPPSAQAAMDVRDSLGLNGWLTVTMVCHFNGSEADEYRDHGALGGRAYDRVKAAEERTLRSVDRVVYVSSWARDVVEGQRGIRTRASEVIWNGISPETVPPVDRVSLGVTADDLLLINVGTLEPRKDQLGLVHLFADVLADCPAARLLLVGDGPQRAAIEAEATSLGVAGRIKLLGHRTDVPALLAAADVYVHHAAAENCPMVLLEASRAGLPWAARPSGGIPELAKVLCGVPLWTDATEPSAAALRLLLGNAPLRREIGRRSRDAFLAGFTQQAMTAAYARVLGLPGQPRVAA